MKLGIQVPWEGLKILYKSFIHGNCVVFCKINLVAIVLSKNSEM